jgi:hypothetical protein
VKKDLELSRTPTRPSRPWRTALVPLVSVFLFLAFIVGLKYTSGPRSRIPALLQSEAQALQTGDREAFMSLQDPTDQDWYGYQTNKLNSRIWAGEHGEPWEPEPLPAIVAIQEQGEEAWVTVETEQGGTTRRKVEFFRRVDGEWKHTGPDERYWGEPRQAHTEHLRWTYRARDEEWVTPLLDHAEAAYRRICGDFGLDPAGQQVTLEVVYAMDEAYLPLYPEGPNLPLPSPLLVGLDDETVESVPATLLLNYLGARATGGDPSTMTRAHRTLLDAIESWEATQLSLDSWWASHGEPQLGEAIEAGQLLPLSQVWGEGGTQEYALAHVQSYSAVEYLVERHGAQSIPALVQALGSQPTVEQALRAALGPGFAFEAFEAGWRAWIEQQYGLPGTPSAASLTAAPGSSTVPPCPARYARPGPATARR